MVGPSLAASLEPLAYCQIVASLSLFIGITSVDAHQNWFNFLLLEGGLLIILVVCMIFLSSFLDFTRMSMPTISVIAQLSSETLWRLECFPLNYDLNGFKSRINRHSLTVGSFWTDFLYALVFLCFFFL